VAIEHRLSALARSLGEILDRLEPQELALEEAFFGKSVQSALRIGEARGVVLAEASRRQVAVHQFAPARIKRCLTGHGAASKEAVAQMTARLLALDRPPQPMDATDALAVALCRVEARRHHL
jgi:crossover junction endodeoxyribonuclease RuvC